MYIHICKYQPFDHLSAQDIKLQHQTRLAWLSKSTTKTSNSLAFLSWLTATRKPNEAMKAMSLEGLVVEPPTIGWEYTVNING